MARFLNGLSVALTLLVIPLFVKMGVDRFLPDPPQQTAGPEEPSARPEEKPRTTMDAYRPIWENDLLEPAPNLPDKKPEEKPKPPEIKPEQIPFEWGGVMAHSRPEKSMAILIDRNTRKQMLVHPGEIVKGSDYRVLSISAEEIRFIRGDREATLSRPRPKIELSNKPKDRAPDPTWLSGFERSVTLRDQRIIVNESHSLASYGFQENDQLVAVEGERVNTISQLKSLLSSMPEKTKEIAVLRHGRLISLKVSRLQMTNENRSP